MDQKTISEYGIPVVVLMERAGLAVVDVLCEMLPSGGRVTVFCGKGNNGGDGLVVARHALAKGYAIECLIAAKEQELSNEAKTQLAVARAQGVQPIFYDDPRWERKADCVGCRDLIVDALLGTGAKGEIKGPCLEAICAINRSGVPVLSVDVPSGIDCDTGEDLGDSVWATRTVTFGLPKPFLFQGLGLDHSGCWSVADIGFPRDVLEEETDARLIDQDWCANLLPERLRNSHKGENGHVLIVAGSQNMPGAATLAVLGALRSGAGLVTLASIPTVCQTVASHIQEAIYLPLPEENGAISPSASSKLIDLQEKYDAALFGPGMTHQDSVRSFLELVWTGWDRPCCIDADALNSISQGVAMPKGECILTPHPGEMSRLLHCSAAEVEATRFETVHQAVSRLGKTILLKGPYSIVGEAHQPLAVNRSGNPGMATGGMGDVLSGVITTLLAQELPPYCAATCAMYWHGVAGDICAERVGPIGYRASEVAEMLPLARAKLTARC